MTKNPTGVGEYTRNLLDAIFKIDQDNQYYLFYNSWTDVSQNIPQWHRENVRYVYTRWPNKLLNSLLWLKFIKLDNLVIKNLKLKIDTWFSPNLNFTHLSKHIKRILTIHDLSFEFFPECFTFKQRLWHWFLNPECQCQKADMILTPSENTRRDVIEVYKVESHKVIKLQPWISCNLKLETYNLSEVKKKYDLPEKYILYLGTLEPRKNVEVLIDAYTLCQSQVTDHQSLIIAGGSGWKNKKLLKMTARTPGVKYIGYVPEEDKSALYRQASLFVFPSLYEGFGLPVLEAIASGAPVITSNRSSLPEVAGDGGYLVNPHNVAEIAEAMKKILSDNKLRDMLVERGKRKVENFTWNKSAADLKNIFQKVAG